MEDESSHHRPALAGKRILVVLGCFDLGGTERQAIQLAHQLQRRHEAAVEVWGFRPPGRAAELCDRLGVAWRFVPEPWGPGPLRWPGMIYRFSRLLARQRVDILLPFTSFPNTLCGLCWRLAGAGVCIWNQRDAGLNLDSRAAGLAVRNTPLFLSNSQVGADLLRQRFRVRPHRIEVVHNAVCLEAPAAERGAWRARLNVDPAGLLAVMVSNVRPPKDHRTLLEAWRLVVDRLAASDRRAVLALAGTVEAGHPLPQIVRELNLENHVCVPGPVDDVAGLLAAADVAVYSSLSEGCPNGVLESMAAGLAVVASDIPGIREALGTESAAWLVPSGDAPALADRIVRLADDSAMAAAVGVANRRRVETAFSPDTVTDRLARLLQHALFHRRWPT